MSNIYDILKFFLRIKSRRLKLFGLWLLHCSGRRYIGIFLDPVLACNLRCKMCYFSDDEKRKTYHGSLTYEAIELIASKLFHRALKLQIGCGAEPTLHKDLIQIIALGKRHQVPYISLTTNGQLLTKELLFAAAANGLNELTLSTHGLTRLTYESFMTHASFDRFCSLLADVADVKKSYPTFRLRINYTMNVDNFRELTHLWEIVGDTVDILQIRPIQQIGESAYQNFDLSPIYEAYDEVIAPLIDACKQKGIICLAPEKENLQVLETTQENDNSIEQFTYCYVSAKSCWQDDFDYHSESFETYASSHHWGKRILEKVLQKPHQTKICTTRKMNYTIK